MLSLQDIENQLVGPGFGLGLLTPGLENFSGSYFIPRSVLGNGGWLEECRFVI